MGIRLTGLMQRLYPPDELSVTDYNIQALTSQNQSGQSPDPLYFLSESEFTEFENFQNNILT